VAKDNRVDLTEEMTDAAVAAVETEEAAAVETVVADKVEEDNYTINKLE
jgi:hypothetical protein